MQTIHFASVIPPALVMGKSMQGKKINKDHQQPTMEAKMPSLHLQVLMQIHFYYCYQGICHFSQLSIHSPKSSTQKKHSRISFSQFFFILQPAYRKWSAFNKGQHIHCWGANPQACSLSISAICTAAYRTQQTSKFFWLQFIMTHTNWSP